VSLLSLIPFLLLSHCSLAAMKDMRVVFPDIAPATQFACHASAMSISLSHGGLPIIPQIGLLPSWVAIIAGLGGIALRNSISASFDHPGVPEVSLWGQFDAGDQMPMSVCRFLPSDRQLSFKLAGVIRNILDFFVGVIHPQCAGDNNECRHQSMIDSGDSYTAVLAWVAQWNFNQCKCQ